MTPFLSVTAAADSTDKPEIPPCRIGPVKRVNNLVEVSKDLDTM
jgi:hypothetical protein